VTTPPTLLDRADARWAAIGAGSPDLGPAVRLQRALVSRTIEAVRALSETGVAVVEVDLAHAAEKLGGGLPVFRGEAWTPPVELLGPLVFAACDDLAAGGAGEVARHVRVCLDEGRVDVGSLLAASLDRNQRAILEKALHESIAPDVLWLAAELAAAPAAYVAQRRLAGARAPAELAAALRGWTRGYCPACGSWPAFTERVAGDDRHRCSFCGFGWTPTAECSYCGANAGHLTWLKEDPAATRRAQVCSGCGGYLKHLTLPALTPFELLPLEDLASSPLDRLAAAQGFGRPPLPELTAPGRSPCQPTDR